jgi:hypothetical protein
LDGVVRPSPAARVTYGDETTATSTATTTVLYAGEYRDDESGFSYLRARYCGPVIRVVRFGVRHR